MSARPTWKGVLQIGRVRIPIKVFPATENSESLSFNQLHDDCQTRVTQRKWCTSCKREVPSAEIVKGFEFEKGRYVILNEHELDAVKPESTRVIDLLQFAPAAALDPLYIDRTYYLAPDGGPAGDAYAVMSAGMKDTVGIGKLALYGREYLVAVRPLSPAAWPGWTATTPILMLHTLHHAGEIRDVATIGDLAVDVDPKEVALARQVIAARTGALHLADFTDQYQADLRRLIDAKIAGEEIVIPPVQAPTVMHFRDALVMSLEAVKKLPAKAALPVTRKRAS
jgi:DNA end-binding protein Ku